MDHKAILKGAKAISDALHGPGGQIKLSRVIARHLAWFELVRSRDMTWDQIIKVLAAAGATRENGPPFTLGHLSSAVWRAQKGVAKAPNQRSPTAEAPPVARKAALDGRTTAPEKAMVKVTVGVGQSASTERKSFGDTYLQPAISVSPGQPPAAGNFDIMNRMRRAAKMRRQSRV
jgi:hypothetical protein